MSEDPQQAIGKTIKTVKVSRETGALRVDFGLSDGGTLTIRLSRPGAPWRILMDREPYEVCMRWDSGGSVLFCCGNDVDNDADFSDAMMKHEIKGLDKRDGAFRLLLDDREWTPEIEWITARDTNDNVGTIVERFYHK